MIHRRLLCLLAGAALLAGACTSAAPASPTAAPPSAASAAQPAAAPGSPAAPSAQSSPSAAAAPSAQAGQSAQAAAPAPSGPATRITVSSATGSPNDQPVWVAQETGIFQSNGLSIDLQYLAAAQGITALLGNQVQISHTGGAETVGALAGGADLVIVANVVPVLPYQFYAGPSIQTPADLKGKKIGITTAGASYDTALRIVLPKLGLDPDRDVTLIPTGSIPNVTAALFNGAIDGAPLVVSPAAFRTVQGGNFHEIFDFAPNAGPYAGDLVVVKRDYLNQNRDVVQRYIDALVQGIARFKVDRATSIQIDKKYLDETDDTLVARTYDYFIQSATPSQPFPRPEQFPEVVATLAKTNDAVKDLDVNKALDPSLVQSAIDRGLDR
jgi:NitT/TauT family transport system substrate-binding protein